MSSASTERSSSALPRSRLTTASTVAGVRVVAGPTKDVLIIGAGLGGLSAALHLAGAGRRVTVVEREQVPGGRCGLIEDSGYRFDTGPTVLTMPDLVAAPLNAVGEELADWLTLHRLDPAYRARFADGSTIDVRADVHDMADEIAATCGGAEAAAWLRYVEFLRKLYAIEMPHFIDRNLDSPRQLVNPSLARLVALGGFRRLSPKIGSFFADYRLRRLFSFQAMYAGLAPAQALAIYAVITYMDCVQGVFFPDGGMHAVPRALAAAAQKHGVRFRYGTTVQSIDVRGGRAAGVITGDGERIPADVVVVNADLPTAYQRLLPEHYRPRRLNRLRYSPSAVVLHAGSSTGFDELSHHTIEFGDAWDETFDEIIRRGQPMSDPSFLLTAPSATDASLAPTGRHSYYALFPAPNMTGRVDWHADRGRYRDHVVETIEKRGYAGFGAGIEVEHLVTPADWQAAGLAAGAPFAAAHTFGQTGPFRPATLDRRIENLVFCGSNTQPGVGVPMVLVSGRLAAERITGPTRP
jgi:phytoene desaturase